MLCPKCGTETIRILGDEYCPQCSKEVSGVPEEKVSEIRKEKEKKSGISFRKPKVKHRDSFQAITFGFLATIITIFLLFIVSVLLVPELSGLSRLIFLALAGLSGAFIGGFVGAVLDPKNYIKDALILALISVLLNTAFNFLADFNFLRTFLSLLAGMLIYPFPFLAGAGVSKRWKFFK